SELLDRPGIHPRSPGPGKGLAPNGAVEALKRSPAQPGPPAGQCTTEVQGSVGGPGDPHQLRLRAPGPAPDAAAEGVGYSDASSCMAASSAGGASSISATSVGPPASVLSSAIAISDASISSAGASTSSPSDDHSSADSAGPPSAGCHICSPVSGSMIHSPCAHSSPP